MKPIVLLKPFKDRGRQRLVPIAKEAEGGRVERDRHGPDGGHLLCASPNHLCPDDERKRGDSGRAVGLPFHRRKSQTSSGRRCAECRMCSPVVPTYASTVSTPEPVSVTTAIAQL